VITVHEFKIADFRQGFGFVIITSQFRAIAMFVFNLRKEFIQNLRVGLGLLFVSAEIVACLVQSVNYYRPQTQN
jgi:hypothetical protein